MQNRSMLMEMTTSFAFFLVLVVSSRQYVSSSEVFTYTPGELSDISTSIDVQYSCEVTNEWNVYRHPRDYPEGKAGWGSPVLLAAKDGYQLWGPGQTASPGVKQFAETGEALTLSRELDDESTGTIGSYVIGQKIKLDANTNSQTLDALTVSNSHPYITSISTVIPSPDWFSGFYRVDIRGPGNKWYKEFVIDTYPWDAGTKMGNTYEDEGQSVANPAKISQMTVDTIPTATGPFLDTGVTDVLSVLNWDCKLLKAIESSNGKDETIGDATTTSTGTTDKTSAAAEMFTNPQAFHCFGLIIVFIMPLLLSLV